MPWDVLHQGLSLRTGWSIGAWSIIVGALAMLLWLPLRQRPGIGTLSNVVVVGVSVDVSLLWLPAADSPAAGWLLLSVGIVTVGAATGCYIGASRGPGPGTG